SSEGEDRGGNSPSREPGNARGRARASVELMPAWCGGPCQKSATLVAVTVTSNSLANQTDKVT
ncbi:TOR1AIP1 isoform 7, partial [Pongo abelii]